ncbi:ATP-dependent Lon protease [Salinivibrio sp. PR932]|uniref:ATP-dependent Lon protease n=1 Tax=Salinivibrio sp. PR932 TaxID=1909492 RepID=UPI000988EC1A|nr:ATP-dependent Lon protease [Salinivibrio sp. PR932]OOF18757.1 ATP-dependent Lon protease [Salinivibrio sp. PR932]
MNISPASVSIPTVAPSVNPPTEQVARENRVREKIVPTKQPPALDHERPATEQDKQLRNPSWDPSQHPNYSFDYTPESFKDADYNGANVANRIDAITRSEPGDEARPENGYPLGLKMPEEVLEKIEQLQRFERTRAVVAMRYQQATVANMPSEVLIVI